MNKIKERKQIKINVLDCTLRDGGYYNNWDFPTNLVSKYLFSLSQSKIDYVELGFRFLKSNSFYSNYAYTTDNFLDSLELPKNLKYGVMINAKEFLSNPDDIKKNVRKLFCAQKDSKISLVRMAINFDNAKKIQPLISEFKLLGYQVGLNLMQSHGKSKIEYQEVAKKINSWDVDILYFADSLGNMDPENIEFICKNLKIGWKGPLGIHTHNNKGHALINSVTAVKNGVSWVDATITGMGRGAGNAPTESLILELSRLGLFSGNPLLIQPAVTGFTSLKEKYNWGSNFYYHYAAIHNIHPTYVQTLLDDKRYTKNRIIKALKMLTNVDSSSFSKEKIRNAVYSNQHISGKWNAEKWVENDDILIVGAGDSLKKNKSKIEEFILKKKPKVLFLNINFSLDQSLGFATIICNETRALLEVDEYRKLNHPLIMPLGNLSKILKDKLKGLDILDYGLSLKKNHLEAFSNNCFLDSPLAIGYALCLSVIGNANKIFLAGFDGYKNDNEKNNAMNQLLKKYCEMKNSVKLIFLTPTSYDIAPNDSIDEAIL